MYKTFVNNEVFTISTGPSTAVSHLLTKDELMPYGSPHHEIVKHVLGSEQLFVAAFRKELPLELTKPWKSSWSFPVQINIIKMVYTCHGYLSLLECKNQNILYMFIISEVYSHAATTNIQFLPWEMRNSASFAAFPIHGAPFFPGVMMEHHPVQDGSSVREVALVFQD